MGSPVGSNARRGAIQRFVSGMSFPKLFLFLSGLFLLDLAVPDLIPFLDEAILGTLTVLVGMWREKRASRRSGA